MVRRKPSWFQGPGPAPREWHYGVRCDWRGITGEGCSLHKDHGGFCQNTRSTPAPGLGEKPGKRKTA